MTICHPIVCRIGTHQTILQWGLIPVWEGARLPVIAELQRDAEIAATKQADDGLQLVL